MLRTSRSLFPVRSFVPLALLSLTAAPYPASFSPVSAAHAQDQLWLTQFGTSKDDRARALAPDGAAGVFVAGSTDGILGGRSAGGFDSFLARHDSAGNQLWIRQFGSGFDDGAYALAPADAGGVFIAGIQRSDAFLARYDSAGNQLWFRQLGSLFFAVAWALAPDRAGGVFVGGCTWGSLGGPPTVKSDAFLARYDGEGNQIWFRQWGGQEFDEVRALAPDGAGGVMVAWRVAGAPFVGRYDAAGERLWRHGFEGTSVVSSLAPDGAGGVILAGVFNAFLARLDSAGNRLWIRQFGASGTDSVQALAPDGAGGVMVAGWTDGSLGGPNAGAGDAFISHHDGAGNRIWIRQFGTSELDLAEALVLDGAGGVMVAGGTDGSLSGPNAGGSDAFLARYTLDSCYPDCDFSTGIGVLDIFDFLCFQNSFVLSEPYACECDPDPACNLFDFLCFQNAFAGGCQ